MDKKIIAIIVVLAIVLVGAYMFLYVPYENTARAESFQKSLKNASSTNAEITSISEQFNKQNNTNVETLIKTLNDEISPKYSDELSKLNEAEKFTNDQNESLKKVKSDYISFQKKRVEHESQTANGTIKFYNALAQYYKGEKSPEDAQSSVNNASQELATAQNELNADYTNIRNLLKDNPDFNATLHSLDLTSPFYGEMTQQNTTGANTTNTTNTTPQG